jgi:hypothetical protein
MELKASTMEQKAAMLPLVAALDKNLGKAAKGFRRTVRARRDRSGETLPFRPA